MLQNEDFPSTFLSSPFLGFLSPSLISIAAAQCLSLPLRHLIRESPAEKDGRQLPPASSMCSLSLSSPTALSLPGPPCFTPPPEIPAPPPSLRLLEVITRAIRHVAREQHDGGKEGAARPRNSPTGEGGRTASRTWKGLRARISSIASRGRERDGWPHRAPPPLPSSHRAPPHHARRATRSGSSRRPAPPRPRAAAMAIASFLEATHAFSWLAVEGGREGADPLLRLLTSGAPEARGKQPSGPRAGGMGDRRGTTAWKEFVCGSNSLSLIASNHCLPIQGWGNCWR